MGNDQRDIPLCVIEDIFIQKERGDKGGKPYIIVCEKVQKSAS